MRDLTEFDAMRIPGFEQYGAPGELFGGAFAVYFNGQEIRVIVSIGDGWQHVSVSCAYRCPTWDEMEYVKRTFFREEETAMQLHVPPSDHINIHPHCLHLWRPIWLEIPRPPSYLV